MHPRYQSVLRGWLVCVMLWALAACSVTQPVSIAETPEQQAFALYGTYTILQEAAADIVETPGIPRSIVRSIQEADAAGKPVIDAMFVSALEVSQLRAELAGIENPDELADALEQLLDYIESGGLAISRLGAAMQEGG